jgi:UDP-2,3-diacylglucosamine hydrolase
VNSKKLRVKKIELKNDAAVIADVHYKKGEGEFVSLLKKWIENPPPQVFFLGDIFHLLLPFSFLVDYNDEPIRLINTLSEKTQIYYTPGNHDFNIEKIFPKIVFADAFIDYEKNVILTHGDLTDEDVLYRLYVKFIRNTVIEKIVNVITLNFVNDWMFKKILNKRINCKNIENFEKKIKDKLKFYDYGIIIEGHYHQNKILKFFDKIYINLPAFVCTKSYILIQLDNNPIIKEIEYDGR